MFERYNEPARKALFFARYETSQLGALSIEPEHLLVGLLRESSGIASRILTEAGTTPDRLRAAVLDGVPRREKNSPSVEIPFSAPTKRVLQFAAEEADAVRDHHIGPEHLLIGLVREEHSHAARTLAEHGVRLAAARHAVGERKPEEMELPPSPAAAVSRVLRSGTGISERIERIRVAVAALAVAESEAARSRIASAIGTELDELQRALGNPR